VTPSITRPDPPRSSRPAAPPRQATRPGLVIAVVVCGLVAGLAFVYFLLPRWLTAPDATAPTATATATPSAVDVRRLMATLYYVADDGASLVGVTREVPFGGTPSEQAHNIITAQLAPAPSGSVSAIPAGVTLRGVFLTPRGDAYVDLSHEIITGHPGGSMNESLTVYTLVNALTQNIREITGVQILVDGQQIDTLAGHIDLRQPLTGQPRWVQKGQ
jgi:hypothetical protein